MSFERSHAGVVRLQTAEMAYGPHAVARHAGKIVFVRGGAPDEEVDAVITEERRSFDFAEVVAVVRPSSARRSPPCPYLPRCGGCPWQHLDYAAQREAKRRIVQEHLRRLAGLTIEVEPVIPSPREYGFRHRLKLRVQEGQVGFYAGRSHELVGIDDCLLADPPVATAIPWAEELVRGLATGVRRIELIRIEEESEDLVVVAEAEGSWERSDRVRCRSWLERHPRVRGLLIRGRRWNERWGRTDISLRPHPELLLHATAGSFTQVNPLANQILAETVARLAQVQEGERLLDLYAGVGNLGLWLAQRGARVVAVEQHPQAARDNAANAERLGLTGYEVRQQTAERAVSDLLQEGKRFDVVVLDPPRSGAPVVIGNVLRLAPPRVIYVSCDPATLARDVGVLRERYRIDSVQPIDMFPHSYHVEVVLRATLTC